jgi:hypothetical protein
MRIKKYMTICLSLAPVVPAAFAQPLDRLAEYIEIDTTNPPGNEDRGVAFFARTFEEAGGMFGAGWLVENRPDLFDGVGFLLNEGGRGTRADGTT